MQTLDRDTWQARARAHAARVDVWVEPHLERRRRGVAHPVHDFLFTYYSQRPAQLRRWHPGYGVAIADAPEYADLKGYAARVVEEGRHGLSRAVEEGRHGLSRAVEEGRHGLSRVVEEGRHGLSRVVEEGRHGLSRNHATVTADYLTSQQPVISAIHTLLTATASRPPTLGCFGLHEWAMAYRSDVAGNEIRHDWPLRLGAGGTDEVVESHRIGCSHFDAFRFFTPQARELNTLQPGRDDRPAFEQPGCLHAGMDLYKRAFRLTPLINSELVADAFALAWDIRVLDMRAAPYDFSGVTLDPAGEPWTPVAIETPEGKAEYVAAQREFSERGAPIRQRLIGECERLLGSTS